MDKPPDLAQAMFARDIAPELAKDREFLIESAHPGEILFTDGSAPGRNVDPDLDDTSHERADIEMADTPGPAVGPDGDDAIAQRTTARADVGRLSDAFARHIRVEFSPVGAGTQVRVHGHVERDVCHALERLGTPQHWPEIADLPHD